MAYRTLKQQQCTILALLILIGPQRVGFSQAPGFRESLPLAFLVTSSFSCQIRDVVWTPVGNKQCPYDVQKGLDILQESSWWFPRIRGAFWGPRIIVLWGLYWAPPILGKLPLISLDKTHVEQPPMQISIQATPRAIQ